MTRRVRGKKHLEVHHDPVTGQARVLRHDTEDDALSPDGALDSAVVQEVFFLDCGCRAPAAGRCERCRAFSCAACHGRCLRCAVPVCLQHSVFIDEPGGVRRRLCTACFDHQRRTKRLRGTLRLLLQPFVHFEERHER